jgi:hypothetical protein
MIPSIALHLLVPLSNPEGSRNDDESLEAKRVSSVYGLNLHGCTYMRDIKVTRPNRGVCYGIPNRGWTRPLGIQRLR